MQPWHALAVWQQVAEELRALRGRSLGRLLTEETVRFATVKALADTGIAPDQMRYEWPHPALPGSRIDLVIGEPPIALIELKYPREPKEKNAAWTMIYGEVLRDFYRLAAYPSTADRVFVYAQSARLKTYMTSAGAKYGMDIGSESVALLADRAADLPVTVRQILGPDLPTRTVAARRIAELPVDPTLSLLVFDVAPAPPKERRSR